MKYFHVRSAIPCLLSTGALFLSSYALGSQPGSATIERLTFTNTQIWSPRFLQWAEMAINLTGIALPPSPKNTSSATKKDLAILHAYQDARTEKNIEEIKQKDNIYDAFFGKKTLGQLVGETRRPLTFELMKKSLNWSRRRQ